MGGDRKRLSRRQLLAAGAVCTVTGLSGCSGGGDDGSDGNENEDGSDGDGNEDGDDGSSSDETDEDGEVSSEESEGSEEVASGEVVTDTVDELEIVSHTVRINSEQGLFVIEMTLRNNGDMDTGITPGEYTMEATLYDDSGTELATRAFNNLEDTELPAGETRWVAAVADREEFSEFASYEITLACQDSPLAGAYCE